MHTGHVLCVNLVCIHVYMCTCISMGIWYIYCHIHVQKQNESLSLSLFVYHVRLDWLPLPCIALIWPSQLSCLGNSVGRASAS